MDLLFTISSFSDFTVWKFLIQLFIVMAALLVGNIIRRKIPFIRKSLIPSALIGGFIILLYKAIILFIGKEDTSIINNDTMETLTYHCLALGFISLAIKSSKKTDKSSAKVIVQSGVLTGATYVLQGFIGLLITIVLFYVTGFFPASGLLLALGFGQGTGQALNYGSRFENEYQFTGGTTFGLTIATIGFLVASIVGVTYLNILRRKGKIKYSCDKKIEEKLEDYVTENEIPNTESVDKLTINLAIVFGIYGITYFIMWIIKANLIWGFNFLLGTIIAVFIKFLFTRFKKYKLMHRDLTNNYLLDRIGGFMFDVMIIAGVAAIDLEQLSEMWWQIMLICILGSIATFIYVKIVSKHLYKGYENEGFLAMFGMLTGTASTGMILLREIDPKFETPASTNLVLSGVPAIAFGGALLLLLEYCPKGITQSVITLGILFAAFALYTFILFFGKILKKTKKNEINSDIIENNKGEN